MPTFIDPFQPDQAMGLDFNFPTQNGSIIKVIGVGGGGGNAVNNMYKRGIKGVDFVVCNTDLQVLETSPVPTKIRLGPHITNGLGAGADPNVGRQAALESIDELRDVLRNNTKMVFIAAGMGGGTGTGAAPVIAALAKEMGILTVGIVTLPFNFEAQWRHNLAAEGIKELEQCVDSLLIIKNSNLMQICPKNIKAKDALLMADNVLCNAAKGIAEIITEEGHINVDFADVKTIMQDSGTALMGMATFAGENRAHMAIAEALSSPLLDNLDIHGADGILVNITASEDSLGLEEMTIIGEYVKEAAGEQARIIFGTVYSHEMGDRLSVTVIATGFDKTSSADIGYQQPTQSRMGNMGSIGSSPLNNQRRTPYTPPTPPPMQKKSGSIPMTEGPGLFDNLTGQPTSRIEPMPSPQVQHVQPNLENLPSPPPSHHLEDMDDMPPPTPTRHTTKVQPEPVRRVVLDDDRSQRINSSTYDYSNRETLRSLEDVPAWMRMRRDIYNGSDGNNREQISRVSLESTPDGGFSIRSRNSFLHENSD